MFERTAEENVSRNFLFYEYFDENKFVANGTICPSCNGFKELKEQDRKKKLKQVNP